MNILITGCNGFISSHVTMELLKQKYNVTGIDISENSTLLKTYKKQAQKYGSYFQFIQESVCKTSVISSKQFDVICHLAALVGVRSSIDRPLDYISINIAGHTHILSECNKNKNIPLVYASSSSVYGKK